MIAVLLIFTSCESDYDEIESLGEGYMMDFSTKKQSESNKKWQSGESNYIKSWIDSSFYPMVDRSDQIQLRSSESCIFNVELRISGPADTAKVTVYEANTSIIVHGPVYMTDNDDFDMTINGAKYYDFEVEPIDNPTSSTNGSFIIDPDWGIKSIYFFHGPGTELYQDYNFECPPASTDGTCQAEVAVRKYSGNATSYDVNFDDGTSDFTVEVSGILNDYEQITIDENKIYTITVYPDGDDNGTYEDYSLALARPDQIVHWYSFFHPDTTSGIVNNFYYFDCPY